MQDGEDIFDGSHIAGPSRGRIEGSGIGGAGIGTILQVTLLPGLLVRGVSQKCKLHIFMRQMSSVDIPSADRPSYSGPRLSFSTCLQLALGDLGRVVCPARSPRAAVYMLLLSTL